MKWDVFPGRGNLAVFIRKVRRAWKVSSRIDPIYVLCKFDIGDKCGILWARSGRIKEDGAANRSARNRLSIASFAFCCNLISLL